MMKKLKRTALITFTFFTLITLAGPLASPASADFLSAYQVLKNDYGYVVDRIVAGGATEAEIEAFLVDLEMDVSARGELTKDNFNSLMYQSFEEVIQWRVHRNVFRALLESYGDEIEYTLDKEDLHPELVPIRDAVMEALLGKDEEPAPGGGGGGGGGVPTIPNNDINQTISAALSSSDTIINVNAALYNELVLPGSLLNQVSQKGKTISLQWSGVNLSLPPGAVAIPGSDRLTISINKLSQAKKAEAAQKAGAAQKLVGEIYEIKATTQQSPMGILFNKPIDIALTYSYEEPAEVQKSLAIYYFNEKNQSWEKLTGEHALSARYIRVSTNQPGKYALFAAAEAVDSTEPELISNFIDIKGHWAEQDINTLYQKGLISGVTTFQFEPERPITRAEFAAIMLRALGESPGSYMTGRFYDVPADAWYFNVVNKAAEMGIISGYSSTSFGPQDSITREQIAAIISRAMQLKGKGTSVTSDNIEARLSGFADQRSISVWARNGVAFALENKIVLGRTTTQFAPLATATRAEAAAMILRMHKQL
ncbi:MAG TPA: S-layer homology domain-containing protein [Syntrophomonadaceae bacterium]|nr:S-layer homology domain-containing protein [Syntrophomonadaceae bacterium]